MNRYSYHQIEGIGENVLWREFGRNVKDFEHDLTKIPMTDQIHFDDGWLTQYNHAFPRLAGRNAIFFISTGTLDQPGYMTSDMVAEISKQFEIGCHSHKHMDLRKQPFEIAREEIDHSLNILERLTGQAAKSFVAPYEWYTPEIEAYLALLNLEVMLPGMRIQVKYNTVL